MQAHRPTPSGCPCSLACVVRESLLDPRSRCVPSGLACLPTKGAATVAQAWSLSPSAPAGGSYTWHINQLEGRKGAGAAGGMAERTDTPAALVAAKAAAATAGQALKLCSTLRRAAADTPTCRRDCRWAGALGGAPGQPQPSVNGQCLLTSNRAARWQCTRGPARINHAAPAGRLCCLHPRHLLGCATILIARWGRHTCSSASCLLISAQWHPPGSTTTATASPALCLPALLLGHAERCRASRGRSC